MWLAARRRPRCRHRRGVPRRRRVDELGAEAPEEACGQAYNVACGSRISLLELVDKINKILGTDIKGEHGPPRAGDIQHSLADIGRAEKNLGFKVDVEIDEGLERTVKWLTQ